VTDPEPAGLLVAPEIRDMAGPAALPRANGDLVFDSPWQGRAFGTAVATVSHLGLHWDEFRHRLMAAIADAPDRPYYDSWVVALERLVVDRGLLSTPDIEARSADLTA
jgi:nitrile hydratase accessory protein